MMLAIYCIIFFNHCVLQRGCNVIQTKVVTVRIPEYLLEHCQKRIKELSLYHDMDMSKFVRWLIRNDSQDYVSSAQDSVIHCRTIMETKKNISSFNVIRDDQKQKPPQKVAVWNFPK